MTTQRFKTIVAKTGSRTAVVIPFDPNAVWGVKQHHHISGTIAYRASNAWIAGPAFIKIAL